MNRLSSVRSLFSYEPTTACRLFTVSTHFEKEFVQNIAQFLVSVSSLSFVFCICVIYLMILYILMVNLCIVFRYLVFTFTWQFLYVSYCNYLLTTYREFAHLIIIWYVCVHCVWEFLPLFGLAVMQSYMWRILLFVIVLSASTLSANAWMV